jgi:PPM family protein phosphatase
MTDLPLRLVFGEHTHPGPRDSNQDSVLIVELADGRWLAAVADGMGGLAHGEHAGRVALATMYRSLANGADLTRSVEEANEAVHREAKGQAATGTTLVAAILEGDRAEIVNVGDSRAYHLDSLGLLQVTRDHTMGEEAVRSGAFLGSGEPPGPWATALARFLGAEETVQAETFGPLFLSEGDWLLLCSDGLHRVLPDGEVEEHLRESRDPKQAAVGLVEMALERNTDDNVSVVLVYRPEGGERESVQVEPGTDPEFDGNPNAVAPPEADVAGNAGHSPESGAIRERDSHRDTGAIHHPDAAAPTRWNGSPWDPDVIFTRSPRYRPGQRTVARAGIVIVVLIALLTTVFLALDRALSP